MVSVYQAKQIIEENCTAAKSITIDLKSASGLVLVADVVSPTHSPPFHQSAMDGYAINFDLCDGKTGTDIQGEILAGDTIQRTLLPSKAYRIFTGAPIPLGADTVIIQEHVTRQGNHIFWDAHNIKQGSNIRQKGSQTPAGELAAKAGTKLNAGAMGYLASLGVAHVQVFTQPKIGILVTGSELVAAGTALKFGQIYESNGIALQAALADAHIYNVQLAHVADVAERVIAQLKLLIDTCDVVLITGGISVGDYDFAHVALQQNKVKSQFYKVAQKPGKPLYFGTKGDKLVFGLPGNPASTLTCFYEFVAPAIRKIMGLPFEPPFTYTLPLANSFEKRGTLTQFLKAKIEGHQVKLLTGQESYRMDAFVAADALAVLAADKNKFATGDLVEVHDLTRLWNP